MLCNVFFHCLYQSLFVPIDPGFFAQLSELFFAILFGLRPVDQFFCAIYSGHSWKALRSLFLRPSLKLFFGLPGLLKPSSTSPGRTMLGILDLLIYTGNMTSVSKPCQMTISFNCCDGNTLICVICPITIIVHIFSGLVKKLEVRWMISPSFSGDCLKKSVLCPL